jgi:hypothetical protein
VIGLSLVTSSGSDAAIEARLAETQKAHLLAEIARPGARSPERETPSGPHTPIDKPIQVTPHPRPGGFCATWRENPW